MGECDGPMPHDPDLLLHGTLEELASEISPADPVRELVIAAIAAVGDAPAVWCPFCGWWAVRSRSPR